MDGRGARNRNIPLTKGCAKGHHSPVGCNNPVVMGGMHGGPKVAPIVYENPII